MSSTRSRWVFALGIAAAAIGAWLVLSRGERPLDDVGEASRAELERVLREADRVERGSR